MMSAIRSAAANWLGRVVLTVIMGLLIVSFAIWGIGDIFRGGSTRNVATVGKEVISAEAYRNAFNTELQNLQRRIRRPVTTAEARAFGLDREILNRLIDEAALSAKANRLGLALDEQGVNRSVLEAEIFQTGGRFDRDRYLSLLQQSGLSEQAFLRQQGEFLLRQQLVQGLVGGLTPPSTFNAALHQYREEERSIDVVVIPTAKMPEPAAPSTEALRTFHEERKAEFRTVETRQATILTVSPQIFATSVTLNEAELRAFYEQAVALAVSARPNVAAPSACFSTPRPLRRPQPIGSPGASPLRLCSRKRTSRKLMSISACRPARRSSIRPRAMRFSRCRKAA